MKTLYKALCAACGSALLYAGIAQADHGEISISGQVLAPTCIVNGGNGNLPVSLPDVNATLLSRPGQVAGQTSFQLRLTNCAPTVSRVSTYFEPGPTISPEDGSSWMPAVAAMSRLNCSIAASHRWTCRPPNAASAPRPCRSSVVTPRSTITRVTTRPGPLRRTGLHPCPVFARLPLSFLGQA